MPKVSICFFKNTKPWINVAAVGIDTVAILVAF